MGLGVTTGNANTAIGYATMYDITSGANNIGVGSSALENLTTGNLNVAIGQGAMVTATGNSNCVIIGTYAGDSINNTDADGTVAIGRDSLGALTSGAENTAVGFETLKTTGTGINNTAIGYRALTLAPDGADHNTAVGSQALASLNHGSADGNTAIGRSAGFDNTTGYFNTAVGFSAGSNLTDGNNCTSLGYNADYSGTGAVNETVIGSSATGQGNNTVTLGNSSVTDVYMAQDSQAIVHAQNVPNHVANTMSSPYYRTDGTDDFLSHTNTTLLDVFTNNDDVSFEVLFKMPNTLNEQLFSYGLSGSNYIQFFTIAGDLAYRTAGYGDSSLRHRVNQTLFEADKIYHLAITLVAGSHPTIYVNGNAISFTPVSQSSDDDVSNSGLQIGRGQLTSPAYGEFEFYRFKAFNLELDATEVKELYSGASVPYKYKGANQTNTLGSLDFTSSWSTSNASITDADNGFIAKDFSAGDVGKQYRLRIAGTVSSGNLQVQNRNGSANILTGLSGTFNQTTEYTYEGDNDKPIILRLTSSGATADITHLSIVRVGAVYEYDGSGIASDKWFDKSGNDKHLTVSGASIENAPSGDDGLVYEEGTWTPTDASSAGLSFAQASGRYVRVGNKVTAWGFVEYPTTSDGQNAEVHGLPYNIFETDPVQGGSVTYTNQGAMFMIFCRRNTDDVEFIGANGSALTNANLSAKQVNFCAIYYT